MIIGSASQSQRTPLVIPETAGIIKYKLVCIDLCIEAIILFKNASEPSSSRVYATPVGNALDCVHFGQNVFKMSLAERLDGPALSILLVYASKSFVADLPSGDPTLLLRLRYLMSRLFSDHSASRA